MARRIGLNFHGIGSPARDLEEGEAPYWLSEAQFTGILDRVAAAHDPQAFVLTFDDGNLSDYDIALPALVERGLSARFFVLTGRLDQPGSLGRDHISALLDAGMRVGSHGIAHVGWSGLDRDALNRELGHSRNVLQDICDLPITEAGIPFGLYNARVLRALRRNGYTVAFSSDTGHMNDKSFLRARTSLRGDMSSAQFDDILASRMPPAKQLRRMLGMTKKRLLPLT
ncbi:MULTISPECIES: polysaccharide deacetylase family protein [unclassified Ruegeria]|uniref:polysaccharide deacetylase family protein n=1 Tax=unclassified Ruegeria TaxID=2625375 RepID=UPI00149308F8|nr:MULTISPECIES: polysaccharide deacetylase family protein [unclassified Ruegeria]NOD49766.1 polysaccharide deacetylase family protein [Ruegeria sp. HKCCD5849]NOD54132.1 polysaccharide deacetylase family protein [Ruegeria sp. HKCCD5851]NOD70097.1 polysaccharide deacetylase family protein [Ruegeria sp. HKCCD7303]